MSNDFNFSQAQVNSYVRVGNKFAKLVVLAGGGGGDGPSGDWAPLSAIPTAVSQLKNDRGYITSSQIPGYPTKLSQLDNDVGYLTGQPAFAAASADFAVKDDIAQAVASAIADTDFALKSDIPASASQLVNDIGYLTGQPAFAAASADFATKDSIASAVTSAIAGADFAVKDDIPTAVSQLDNDAGYLTGQPAFEAASTRFALTGQIPVKVSQLDNDAGYLIGQPAFEAASGEFALTGQIPTAVSQLDNDAGYLSAEVEPMFAEASGAIMRHIADTATHVEPDWVQEASGAIDRLRDQLADFMSSVSLRLAALETGGSTGTEMTERQDDDLQQLDSGDRADDGQALNYNSRI